MRSFKSVLLCGALAFSLCVGFDDVAFATGQKDIRGSATIGTYAPIVAPANGLLVTGVVAMGTNTPVASTELTVSGNANVSGVMTVQGGSVGPAAVNCGATCSPAAGSLTIFNLAAGGTATLPTSTGSGSTYRLVVGTTTTSAAEKILLTTTTDVIIGTGIGWTGSTAKVFAGNASTYHSIQMPFAGTQPSGGFAGDFVSCIDIAAGTYECNVTYEGGTTPTTPYSASTT